MEALGQCPSNSLGPANQLFGLFVQTILMAQCNISSPDMWPEDFGPTAIKEGIVNIWVNKMHIYGWNKHTDKSGLSVTLTDAYSYQSLEKLSDC